MQLPGYLPTLVAGLLNVAVSVHAIPTPTSPIGADIIVSRQITPAKDHMRFCNLTGLGPTDWKTNEQAAPLLSDCLQIEDRLHPTSFFSSESWTLTYPVGGRGAVGTCNIGLLVRSPKPEPPERVVFYYAAGDLADFVNGAIERFTVGDRVTANSARFHCQFAPERPILQVEFFLGPPVPRHTAPPSHVING